MIMIKKYMKIQCILVVVLILNKTIEIQSKIVVTRANFYENNKYVLRITFT